jgi:acyl-coenzyme A synthetase/AMP-(fatty) acid ligase
MIFNIDKKNPQTISLIDDNGIILTYGKLAEIIRDSKFLLPERSLIFILSKNDIATATFLLSCLENRWVPLLINSEVDENLLNDYIVKYKPNVIFSNGEKRHVFSKEIVEEKNWLNHSYCTLQTEKHLLYENLSLLLPTSGSTGSPKLVRHSYENLTISSESVSRFFDFKTIDIGLASLPIHYTMGLSVMNSLLFSGAQVRLSNYSMTDKEFWSILKNENITILTGVPYSFEVLLKMRFDRMKIPSLRMISQGGGKLSDVLWDKLVNYSELNNLKFIPTYGQTEGTARMSFLGSEYTRSKKGSIGKAIPNGSFEIWDEKGSCIEDKLATGELVFKGGNVTLGYAESLFDLQKGDERLGVLRTGDIASRDSDGFYYIIGRSKRFVKLFGLRISLDEIELLVKNNFQVDCYCSGTDELLELYVEREDLLEEIKYWLSRKINLFHSVIKVHFIQELPRNSAGKVIFKS